MKKLIYIPAWLIFTSMTMTGCANKSLENTETSATNSQEIVQAFELAEEIPVILFPSGSTNLSIDAREQLREVALLMNHPDLVDQQISIDGHSDTLGDASVNLMLSQQRADSVSRELVLNGVRHNRLIINAKGESQPLVPETTNNGQLDPDASSLNRRVEIFLVENRPN